MRGGGGKERGGRRGFTLGAGKALQGGIEALHERMWRGSPEGVEKNLNYLQYARTQCNIFNIVSNNSCEEQNAFNYEREADKISFHFQAEIQGLGQQQTNQVLTNCTIQFKLHHLDFISPRYFLFRLISYSKHTEGHEAMTSHSAPFSIMEFRFSLSFCVYRPVTLSMII